MDREATEQWIKNCLKEAKGLGILPEKGAVYITVSHGEYGNPPGLRASYYASSSKLEINVTEEPLSVPAKEFLA